MKYLLPFQTLLGANDPWTLKFYSSLGCAFFTLFVTLEYVISTLQSNGSLAGIRFFFSFSRFFTRLDLNVCAIFMMPGCGYDVLNGGKTLHIFFVTFGQIFLSDLLHVCTASCDCYVSPCLLSPLSSIFSFLNKKIRFVSSSFYCRLSCIFRVSCTTYLGQLGLNPCKTTGLGWRMGNPARIN